MNTRHSDCGTPAEEKSRKRDCLPCEIPPFCRNHYYRGKLLTERDFSDEQQYFVDKDRLHNLMLHGYGTVCGLEVKPHPHCPKLRLVVTPGYAIDCCGREIRVTKEVQVELPQPEKKARKPDPCPPDEPPRKPEGYDPRPPYGYEDDEPPPYRPDAYPPEPCDDDEDPFDLYICLRYVECETEFSPAPFDDCSCGEGSQKPNRICEGFEVQLLREKPSWWDAAAAHYCVEDDCRSLYHRTIDGCPKHECHPCLPLAIVYRFRPGQPVEAHQIDNRLRRILPSIGLLDDLVRCILGKLPTKPATRIESFGWSHGDRYQCQEFINRFIGTYDAPRGFEIVFDSDVDAQAIDPRSFQAMVVHRPPDASEPRRMEIAPARIDRGPGPTTRRCTLFIEPAYADRWLEGRSFDLYITLQCNVITGRYGLAVDGDLLATHDEDDTYRVDLPTGDGIPGGEFVSWIRVRHGSRGGGYGYANEPPRRY
jgi:hypothetical protein